MDIGYWLRFILLFAFGFSLVQLSHGKLFDLAKLSFKTSPTFNNITRYIGLFIVIYSCYGVMLDYIIRA